MNGKISIPNYFVYHDLLAAGGQPSREQLSTLKGDGFDAVVNISPVSSRNAVLDESGIVESLKMDYAHFPVDCSNLKPFHYRTFKGILDGFEGKKVFVHCGANIKSSNLIHMYHVLEKGIDESVSLTTLYEIQIPEEKWFKYFRTLGMEGLSGVEAFHIAS